MTHRGRTKNGVIVLDNPAALPEGTEVSVRTPQGRRPSRKREDRIPTLYERMKDLIGIVKLPPDFSENHDHYLYGTPKRK